MVRIRVAARRGLPGRGTGRAAPRDRSGAGTQRVTGRQEPQAEPEEQPAGPAGLAGQRHTSALHAERVGVRLRAALR